ncbi:MAG TPA: hypothetical protein VGN98_14595, partial [Tianweitania sediminis]|nr:hypothetical protein [Tianweitania sediminis]
IHQVEHLIPTCHGDRAVRDCLDRIVQIVEEERGKIADVTGHEEADDLPASVPVRPVPDSQNALKDSDEVGAFVLPPQESLLSDN